MNKLKLNKSIWTGILVAIFSIIYFSGSFGLVQNNSRYSGLGAEFMPRIYSAILMACAIIQLFSGLRELKKSKDSMPHEQWKISADFTRTLIAFALIFVYILMMKWLGFPISSALFLFGLCNLMTPDYAKRNLLAYAVFSVVLSGLTFYLFRYVLYIALPVGAIFK